MGRITCQVFHVFCSNLFCMLLIANSRTSSIMALKKIEMADLRQFITYFFTVIISFRNAMFLMLVIVFNDCISFQQRIMNKIEEVFNFCSFSYSSVAFCQNRQGKPGGRTSKSDHAGLYRNSNFSKPCSRVEVWWHKRRYS